MEAWIEEVYVVCHRVLVAGVPIHRVAPLLRARLACRHTGDHLWCTQPGSKPVRYFVQGAVRSDPMLHRRRTRPLQSTEIAEPKSPRWSARLLHRCHAAATIGGIGRDRAEPRGTYHRSVKASARRSGVTR